ncbi:hypothetical protein LUQ84_000297 [Hamiltosporidium tvaerminnensis]|nr:hypothetical protein LUQ84_000297 [Hamiltosporidium tvaerminnensis]
MNFFRKQIKKETFDLELQLEIISNRLETSQYIEDKLDALKQIYEISLVDPFKVGITCMQKLVSSIPILTSTNLQGDILLKIFKSSNGKEFLDMFMHKEENIKIIGNAFTERKGIFLEILEILIHSDNIKVASIIYKMPDLVFSIVKSLKHSNISFLVPLLKGNEHLRRSIVFEGIFEELIEISETSDDYLLINIFNSLICLLTECHSNQNYFIELKINRILEIWMKRNAMAFDVYMALLDISNSNFKKIQSNFENDYFINLAFIKHRYDFIYRIFYKNISIIKYYLEEKIETLKLFDVYYELENKYQKNYLFDLLVTFFTYKNIKIKIIENDCKYNFYCHVFQNLKEIETTENAIDKDSVDSLILELISEEKLSEFLFDIYKVKESSKLFNLSYFVFINLIREFITTEKPLLAFFIEFLHDCDKSLDEKGICVLFLLEIKINISEIRKNEEYLISCLLTARKLFCNIERDSCIYFREEIINFIISRINYQLKNIFQYKDCNSLRTDFINTGVSQIKQEDPIKKEQTNPTSPDVSSPKETNRFYTFFSNVSSAFVRNAPKNNDENSNSNVYDL